MSIDLKQIEKTFDGKQVLSGFSHSFSEGETTCILGPSGCGKTTLLNLMMGLSSPDSGQMAGLANKRFSAVFQEDRMCQGLTASANIRLVNAALSKEAAAVMLCSVGLQDEQIPVRSFSGGMRRRVAILRALAAEYDILFLDEPLRGLDAETHHRVMEYLKVKTAGKTVICVTHSAEEAVFLSTAPGGLLRMGS